MTMHDALTRDPFSWSDDLNNQSKSRLVHFSRLVWYVLPISLCMKIPNSTEMWSFLKKRRQVKGQGQRGRGLWSLIMDIKTRAPTFNK